MKKKGYLAALAVLAAGSAVLAGCATEQPQSSTPSSSQTATSSQTSVQAPMSGTVQEPGQEQTYLYSLQMKNTGEDTNTETYLQIAERSWKAFEVLEETASLMLMDAYNYQDIDGEGTPLYTQDTLKYPPEIDPNAKCIRVNANYLIAHPVETADGADLFSQIFYSDTDRYVLVPEKYRSMEADILKAYKEDFYFEKVEAENTYNEMASRPERSTVTIDDLSVHIIYLKDGQRYYTYRPGDCAVQDGGWVTDPIVKVYTGNIHCNYAHSFLSQWSYFRSEKATPEEAYQEILPALTQTGTEQSIQQVKLVKDKQ